MAKQIEGAYDAVLACSKREFLENGYQDASLRLIATRAGLLTAFAGHSGSGLSAGTSNSQDLRLSRRS